MSLFPNLANEKQNLDQKNPSLLANVENRLKPKTASNIRRSLQFINSFPNEVINQQVQQNVTSPNHSSVNI